jgi:hypothetical protein
VPLQQQSKEVRSQLTEYTSQLNFLETLVVERKLAYSVRKKLLKPCFNLELRLEKREKILKKFQQI